MSTVTCNTGCVPEESCSSGCDESTGEVPIYFYFLILLLLVLSGLFSGLNLGLLSLDKIGLEIVLDAGTENEKKYARALLPLRAQGNLLLCTLLLGNTAVNAALATLMADLTGGVIGTLSTTFGVVIFGEIIPQSLCSRHGLAIGYYTRHIVWFFLILLYVIAYPIAWVLDYVLDEEIGNVYSREQMMKLFEVHAGQKYGDLINDEITILKGVLQLGKKTVREIMTPIDQVFMLDINTRMDYKNMAKIVAKGHSRIPVFDGEKDNIYKLLLVKNMIMLNPGDEVPLRSLLQEGFPEPLYVTPDITLDRMLNEFQNGGSHLAIVSEKMTEYQSSDVKESKAAKHTSITVVSKRRNIGIVTLEDVIETLIQEPIKDETEALDANNVGQKFLKVLNKKNKFKSSTLSSSEGRAISSFLQGMFDPFRLDVIGSHACEKLVQSSEIIQLNPANEIGSKNVYTAGDAADFCCLVLDGSLRITVGRQNFVAEAGIWKMLGLHSLTDEKYVADFTATIDKPCTILKIYRADYKAALEGKPIEQARKRAEGSRATREQNRSIVLNSMKKIASPTVTALRRQYGNEVEFSEEMKRRGVRGPLLPPDSSEGGDLAIRSLSEGVILRKASRSGRKNSPSIRESEATYLGDRSSQVSIGGPSGIQLMPRGVQGPVIEEGVNDVDDEKIKIRNTRSQSTGGFLGYNSPPSDGPTE